MIFECILLLLLISTVGYALEYQHLDNNKMIIVTIVILCIFTIFILKSLNYYREDFSGECTKDCVKAHSQSGNNYEWLDELGHGKVNKVEFEEPVGSNKWTLYTDDWWHTHCKAVSHSTDLVEAHVNAFIDPEKRFARLRF